MTLRAFVLYARLWTIFICWADCLVSQDDIKLVRVKDYIKNPKENGYRSLHLIVEVPIFLENGKRSVKVEVQLRTIAMEFWANLEHQLRYKKNLSLQLLRSTSRELSECARISAALDMRMAVGERYYKRQITEFV